MDIGRIARGAGLVLGGIVAAVVVATAALYGYVQTQGGRDWLAARIEAALSQPGEREARLVGLAGQVPHDLRLARLELRDPEGAWLAIENLALSWQPLALLSGRLEIERLTARRLDLSRTPNGAAEESTDLGPPALPRLPLGLTVGEIAVEEARLGEAVLGAPARFALRGTLGSRDGTSLESRLSVKRSDGVAGEIRGQGRYDLAEGALSLDLSLSEPEGGLAARLLNLPGLPAVDAKLTGDGRLDDWTGRLGLSLEGLTRAEADLTLSGRTPLTIRLAGQAETEARPGDPLWALLAGTSRFVATAAWDERRLDLENLRLDLSAAEASLTGSLDQGRDVMDLRATVTLKEPGAFSPWVDELNINDLTANFRAKGKLRRPLLSLGAESTSISAPGLAASKAAVDLTFRPSRDLDAGPPAGAFQASGRFAALRLDDLREIAPLIGTDPTWSTEGSVDLKTGEAAWSALTIETGRARLSAPGRLRLDEGDGEAEIAATLADLAGLAELTGLAADGKAEVAGPLAFRNFGETLEARLTARLSGLVLDEPVLQALIGGESSVSTTLALDAPGRLRLSGIALESTPARLSGDLLLDEDFSAITASYAVDLPDTAVLSEALGAVLAGSARAEGGLEGPITDPVVTGRLTSDSLAVEGTELGPVQADYRIAGLAGTPKGEVALGIRPELGPVEGKTDFVLTGGALNLTGLRVTAEAARVAGKASIPLDGAPLSAELSGQSADLRPWAAQAGVAARGAGTASLLLMPDGIRQKARLEVSIAEPILFPDEADAIAAESAALTVELGDLFAGPAGTATLDALGVVFAEGRLDSLRVTARGNESRADWTLDTAGSWREPLALKSAGAVELKGETVTLQLARLGGELLGAPLSLAAPTTLTRAADRLSLAPTTLSLGDAVLDGEMELTGARLNLALKSSKLDLALLRPLWPGRGLSGTLSGTLRAGGAPSDPSGKLDLDLTGLRLSDLKDTPPLDLSVDGDWRGGRLILEGRMTGFAERAASFAADLPLRIDAGTHLPEVPPDRPASAKVAWTGPLAEIWPLVPVTGHRLEGQGDIRLSLTGSLGAPRTEGYLTVENGEYEHFTAGTLLRDLEVRVDLAGRRAVLSRLEASDGGKGRLTARGTLDLDSERDFPFSMDAKLRNFTVLRRDEVTASTDGDLNVTGTMTGARLAGELRTRQIEGRVIDRLPPEVVDLGAVQMDSRNGGILVPAAGPAPEDGFELALDLKVAIPRRAFLRGRGLDSEWAGRFDIAGTAAAPEISGELTVVRGQLSFLGKAFKLERGSVAFEDPKSLDPRLDLSAVNRGDDLTVTASVSGPATNPELTLSSSPDLPEDEIVSRLLFGKTTTQLTSLEAVQLAAAVAELSGADGGGPGIFDLARDTLGVDVLRIESTGTGDQERPALSAGKYVTDEIFVGVKQGADPTSTEVGVEVEVTPNIFLESGVGQTGESNVGVKFKWDY